MTLTELKNKYKTLVGIEVLEIKKVKETVYILIQKNYQGGVFTNSGLELNIRQNIYKYFPDRELRFLWLYPGTKQIDFIIAPGYLLHLSDTLMISRIDRDGRVFIIYIHAKQRIHFKKREDIVRGDMMQTGMNLKFGGFDMGTAPDVISISSGRYFFLTPIPCIAKVDTGRVFFEYLFDKYTIVTLYKQSLKILDHAAKHK